jgi:hypothetical protein
MPDNITSLIDIMLPYWDKKDWGVIASVCKHWNQQAVSARKKANYLQRLEKQFEILGQSELWKYLPRLAERDPSYLNHMLMSFENILANQSFFACIEAFVGDFSKHVPEDQQHLVFVASEGAGKISFLVEQAKQIVQKAAIYHPHTNSEWHSSLKCFLSFPLQYCQEQNEVFLIYRQLEETIFTMSMLIQKHKYRKNISDLILNPKMAGKDLLILNKCDETFLDVRLEMSRTFHFDNAHVVDSDEHKWNENLLLRMSAEEWLAYLSDQSVPMVSVFARAQNFINNINLKNPILFHRCSEALVKEVIKHDESVDKIWTRDFLVFPTVFGQLGIDYIMQLIIESKGMYFQHIRDVAFWNKLTFESVKKMLIHFKESREISHLLISENAKAFLSKNVSVNKLTLNQILELTIFLNVTELITLFNEPIFVAKLKEVSPQASPHVDKIQKSHFLLSLVRSKAEFVLIVASNENVVSMIVDDDRKKIQKIIKANFINNTSKENVRLAQMLLFFVLGASLTMVGGVGHVLWLAICVGVLGGINISCSMIIGKQVYEDFIRKMNISKLPIFTMPLSSPNESSVKKIKNCFANLISHSVVDAHSLVVENNHSLDEMERGQVNPDIELRLLDVSNEGAIANPNLSSPRMSM